MTCRAGHKLRLVSKSGQLNLAATEQLHLSAPKVELSSRRLYLLEGIEFHDKANDSGQLTSLLDSKQQLEEQKLWAFDLMLVDGLLTGVGQ